jgi:hypothetical protein
VENDFVIYKCIAMTDPLKDGLLSGEGEGQVDAVHGHPVQVALPPIPLPECKAVADGAHVLVVAEPVNDSRKKYSILQKLIGQMLQILSS